ncbi:MULTISPECIES: YkvA family protein [unclassified Solwaraspora]|uniref:YkvA family protein n=1 Tax=unclassified Solwaraspora TaxID=2627926 RepID=UPI00248D1805|nr:MULTISPECIES: YkvA family protein [unclassified Solwaraspora]WBB96209.1 YkvA family protein [Solwaraspora sp. WMMA2059]WBC19887.1 YkvA family protein [Solwaraspora sp. WMMA2080]WJK32520.1 YkvA family protein [Solwaraspora sp. WMMA2065]
MARTLKRAAAFAALGRALTAGTRGGPSLGRRLAALPRMIRATMRGDYDGGLRLALMTAAVAYVASPFDLVPEAMLLMLGIVDDALVVTWLAGTVLAETERFLDWEARRDSVVPGQVVG